MGLFGGPKKNEAMEEKIAYLKMTIEYNYKDASKKALADARSNLDALKDLNHIKDKEYSYYNQILNDYSSKIK